MSRGDKARRKAKRLRPVALVPALAIVSVLAAVAALGLNAGDAVNRQQIAREVSAMLDGIPQDGPILGSPRAPITLLVYADLECPTVKRFVVAYLPSILSRWVRNGKLRLEYRSLKTDTVDEEDFFRQEMAALAAGRQDRMWNFALTFVHEQQEEHAGYATDAFLSDIASQVPGLERARWRRDRTDLQLFKRVALTFQAARLEKLHFTPSFAMALTNGRNSADAEAIASEVGDSIQRTVLILAEEAVGDRPAFNPPGA